MLLSLVVASPLVMGSPGPSTISATAVGAAFGLGRSLAYAAGLVAGTLCVLLASAAYILYLAFRIATAPPLSRHDDTAAAAPSFAGGLLLALANPKAYVAIAAVFAASTLGTAVKIAVLC